MRDRQREYEAWRQGTGTTSHDAFLIDRAIACMATIAPEILLVALGEQEHPAYQDQTLMLVLPDHGRGLERPGGPGFLHHSDFYMGQGADEGCRRVWMLVLGPRVAHARTVDRPTPLTSVAATGLEYLGLEAHRSAEPSVLAQTA